MVECRRLQPVGFGRNGLVVVVEQVVQVLVAVDLEVVILQDKSQKYRQRVQLQRMSPDAARLCLDHARVTAHSLVALTRLWHYLFLYGERETPYNTENIMTYEKASETEEWRSHAPYGFRLRFSTIFLRYPLFGFQDSFPF